MCLASHSKALVEEHHPATSEETTDVKEEDGQWYGGTKGTCSNLIYFFTSICIKALKETSSNDTSSIHVYAKSWVNFTQPCVLIIQTRTAQKEVWSLWTKRLNSQLRLTHTKDLRQEFMWGETWSSKCFCQHHFPEVLQEESCCDWISKKMNEEK